MKHRAAALLLLVFAIGCASSDDDPMNAPRAGGRRGGWGGGSAGQFQRPDANDGGIGILADDWWHDPQISAAVNLSADQYKRLTDLGTKQSAERERLSQESANAMRDFRLMLDAENPTEADLEAAGKRLRDARDRVIAQQVENASEQRLILTKQQWQALQDAMREQRRNRRDEMGGRGGNRGGMGGGRRGGGGRRPF